MAHCCTSVRRLPHFDTGSTSSYAIVILEGDDHGGATCTGDSHKSVVSHHSFESGKTQSQLGECDSVSKALVKRTKAAGLFI